MSSRQRILSNHRALFPTGRAFRMAEGSTRERIFSIFAKWEAKAFDDAMSTMDALIPDNDRFTEQDATDWERRLGLVTNLATSLADRKLAILQKMAGPPPNGYYKFIESQLQAAGFNVYVHENRFADYPSGYYEQNPADLYPSIMSQVQHGDHQHGGVQHGYYLNHVVVNSIYNSVDIAFVGGSLRQMFFIGGQTLGTAASVPASREAEFRQLILRLKQVKRVAILFINYV